MDYKLKAIEIRESILRMLNKSKTGHSGGSLSCVDILVSLYYSGILKVDPQNQKGPDRDRFVMSKGHSCPALYAVLADKGFFPKEDLMTLRKIDSHLQGHPDMHKTPGVDISTGSLGQGASAAMGMALAGKLQKKDYKVFTLIGDGEAQEGLIWEMAMAAAHYKLDNFCVILDHNGLQIDGRNDEVMSLGDVMAKFAAFGFECFSVDGHNIEEMTDVFSRPNKPGMPRFVECRTVKGKGVSFMENQVGWHGKAPNDEELKAALTELEAQKNG